MTQESRLEFWGATREVTGSAFLLHVGSRTVLVDCGLIQGRPQDEARNAEPLPFDVNRLDAVILTHAHLDHSGRLPVLRQQGYRGPIHCHRATAELVRILLADAGYLQEREAEWQNRKRERKGLQRVHPLYTRRDAERLTEQLEPVEYDVQVEAVPGVRFRLRNAGHILGAASVEVWLPGTGGQERKLVFSGDLGQYGQPIVCDPTSIAEADLLVMEGTYGDRCHRPWNATLRELHEVFTEALAGGGNVLIPAFAVGRTQELLYLFKRHWREWGLDRWQIFLDSPLAIEATEIYARHRRLYDAHARETLAAAGELFHLPNLRFTESAEASMALNRIRSGAIIIAGSGMCTGGRIRHHLKHNVWRQDCHVVIVGFQAKGTLGRQLVDGARFVRLWGESIRVAARVHTVGGLSAHADQSGLLRWYGDFRLPPPVALVHGEPEPLDVLAQKLREAGAPRVWCPKYGEAVEL